MKLHGKVITKPRSADSNDVQEALDLLALIGNLLSQIDAFLADIKSQASS